MKKLLLIFGITLIGSSIFASDISCDFESGMCGLLEDRPSASVSGGKLVLSSSISTDYANAIDVVNSFTDMDLSVDAEFTSTGENAAILVFFRTQGNDNGYAACFYPGGYFNIQNRNLTGGSVTFILTSSIKCSYITSTVNNVQIITVGSEMQFYCNGEHIYTLDDATYAAGTIGLGTGGIATIEYDNLVVSGTATLSSKIHSSNISYNFESVNDGIFWKDWYGSANTSIVGGKLRMDGDSTSQLLSLDADLLTEDSISFRADIVTPDPNTSAQPKYGLFFFTQFNGAYINAYIFNVYNKYYFLFKAENGVTTQLAYAQNNALLAGGGDFTLVPHYGGAIDIFLNGSLIDTFNDTTTSPLTGGGIGLNVTGNHTVDFDNVMVKTSATAVEDAGGLTDKDAGLSAIPNPFNPSTKISWANTKASTSGLITIYNIKGELVHSAAVSMNSGAYNWKAGNLSSGQYLVKLSSEDFSAKKIVSLIK